MTKAPSEPYSCLHELHRENAVQQMTALSSDTHDQVPTVFLRMPASNATLALNVGLCLRRDLMVIDLSRFGLLSGHFYGERSRLASCS